MAASCVFNPNDRCGDNQVIYGDNARCVCAPGTAYTALGCVPCGEHEVPGNGACVCEAGYTRASASDPCAPQPTGLGLSCDPAAPSCADPKYDHCEAGHSSGGYCTSTGCGSSAECEGGYACDKSVSPSVCVRPPVGMGKTCGSSADCAGTEATYCDTFVSHTCLVQGCTVQPDDCFEGLSCCDLSSFGITQPICVPTGSCPK